MEGILNELFFFLFQLITAVVTKNWKEIVQSCDLQNWREALAAVLTYARPDEFASLCGIDSGDRWIIRLFCLTGNAAYFPSSKYQYIFIY